MKLIKNVRTKIKRVNLSQRARHESIKAVLEDIIDLIEQRCGEDPTAEELSKAIGEKKDGSD